MNHPIKLVQNMKALHSHFNSKVITGLGMVIWLKGAEPSDCWRLIEFDGTHGTFVPCVNESSFFVKGFHEKTRGIY